MMSGYGELLIVRAAVRIIPSHEKWPTEADPSFIRAAIYASASKAVQPPDDRTYSAEVTVFQRNLLHHRSARSISLLAPEHDTTIILICQAFFQKNPQSFFAIFVHFAELFFAPVPLKSAKPGAFLCARSSLPTTGSCFPASSVPAIPHRWCRRGCCSPGRSSLPARCRFSGTRHSRSVPAPPR